MSSYEYYDLFEKAQKSGKYHMFIFDIKNSKQMDQTTRINAEILMEKLMIKIYNKIKDIEFKTNNKILVINTEDIVPYENRHKVDKKFGMLFEPFLFADTFGFTIYSNSLSSKEIINIYNQYKHELDINFDFHISNGYYETNKYEEGNTLFFRGYCIDILSNYHKPYYKKLRRKNKNV